MNRHINSSSNVGTVSIFAGRTRRITHAMLATVVVMSLAFAVGCSNEEEEEENDYGGNPFVGTWVSSEGYIAYFEETSWHVLSHARSEGLKGTYTYEKNAAAIIYTEITDDGVEWRAISASELSRYVRTATVSKNTLTWGATTYTRQ